MWPRVDGLRSFGLGSPGEMRDRLTGLVLDGTKTATAGLLQQDYLDESEDLDVVGEHQVLLGTHDEFVALVEITRVELHPFAAVSWEFAQAEGEGFTSISDWRERHLRYYEREGLSVTDETLVVCTWFRVLDETALD